MYKDLGTLPGGQRSVAFATNTAGQVVGWSALNSRDIDGHAFLWQEGRGMTDLGVLPGDTFSRAYAINTSGQIIGISIDSETLYDRAFLWTKNAGMEQISTTPDFATAYTSAANGINDSGQIVGSAANNNGPFHAFIWTKSSGMQDLNLMITTNSRWVLEEAIAINNAGQIACYGYLTSDPDRRSRPFLLTPVN
jgi:probable HAF family extracellular repeat protein